MSNDHDVVEGLPPELADLGDEPVQPPEADTPDENEGDAYADPANTRQSRADDPSFEDED